jgi:hypothetical protein
MMRKKVFSVALTCGLFAVMSAATAYAQMPGTAVRASIPFDFSVRGKILPAGDYEIRRINDGPDGLVISSRVDKHERVIFETEPIGTKRMLSRSEIIFLRYGDNYFMSEIFPGGGERGRELLTSRRERRLRNEMAANKTEPETVSLAAY